MARESRSPKLKKLCAMVPEGGSVEEELSIVVDEIVQAVNLGFERSSPGS